MRRILKRPNFNNRNNTVHDTNSLSKEFIAYRLAQDCRSCWKVVNTSLMQCPFRVLDMEDCPFILRCEEVKASDWIEVINNNNNKLIC